MTTGQLKEIEDYSKKIISSKNIPQHTWGHIIRVRKNALKIVKILNLKNMDLNILEAACILHDVPVIIAKHSWLAGHFLERQSIKLYLPVLLTKLGVSEIEKKILFNAIYNHPFSIPYRHLNKNKDIFTQVLQDADSLDYFSKEREMEFRSSNNMTYLYRLVIRFSKRYFLFGRKHIHLFLNFPNTSRLVA